MSESSARFPVSRSPGHRRPIRGPELARNRV